MKIKKFITLIIILSIGLVPTLILTFLPYTATSATVDGIERSVSAPFQQVKTFQVQFTAGQSYTITFTESGWESLKTIVSDSPYFITGNQVTGTSGGPIDLTQRIIYNATRTGTHYLQISTDDMLGFISLTIRVSAGIVGGATGAITDVSNVLYPILMLLPVVIAALIGIVVIVKWDRLAKINFTPKFSGRYSSSGVRTRRRSLYVRKPSMDVGTDIEIKRQFEYMSGFVRVKTKISNNSSYVITNVRFQLELSEAFVLRRVEPDYKVKADEVQLGEISPNTEKTIGFTVEPQICGKEKFYGNLEYRDHLGTPKVLTMRPIEVEVVCPLFFTEVEANVAKLTNLIRTKLKKSDERCYAIPTGLDPSLAFTILRDTIERHHVKFVSEDIDKDPTFEGHAWYYGKSKVHELDFVIQVVVSETSKSMKVMVDCGDDVALTGFLSEIGRQMRKGILKSGAITTIGDLKALRCPSCAGPLEKFPDPGKTVTCGYCNFKVTFF